jgi:flagellar protein FliS
MSDSASAALPRSGPPATGAGGRGGDEAACGGSGDAPGPFAPPRRDAGQVYEEALRLLAQAFRALEHQDLPRYGCCLGLVRGCLDTLCRRLDEEVETPLVRDLRGLYRYLAARVLEARVRHDPELLEESIRMLESLHEGWRNWR